MQLVELLFELRLQRKQVPDVVQSVFHLFRRQRTPGPIGASMRLRKVLAEEAANQLRVPDLGRQADECRCNLRVEQGTHQSNGGQQNLEILSRSVHDLHRARCGQDRREWCQVRKCERIHAHGVARRRQLQQAQLRAIGALAQEFRVEPQTFEGVELRGQRREPRRCRDYRVQRVQG